MEQNERRDRGLAYTVDGPVKDELSRCRRLLQKFNTADWGDLETLSALVQELLGKSDGAVICPPFYCDYGSHIETGKGFFANFNCTILDVAKVTFGDRCLLGPNVAIYTAGHPIHPATRATGYGYGRAVTFGDDVWLGGNVIVCPGVRIGSGAVIGAGSVVTSDIPAYSIAAGNPCRVLRRITEADRRKLFRNEEIDAEAWDDIVRRGTGGTAQ